VEFNLCCGSNTKSVQVTSDKKKAVRTDSKSEAKKSQGKRLAEEDENADDDDDDWKTNFSVDKTPSKGFKKDPPTHPTRVSR
jgi:hypothetical protein